MSYEKEKEAGWKSELASGLNPLNLAAMPFAGAAALSTPTKSYDELAQRLAKDNLLENLKTMLVPGVGPYQSFKRTGTAIRSPEMKKLRAEHEASKKDKPEEEKEAGWLSELVGHIAPPNAAAHFATGGATSLTGQLGALMTPTRSLKEQAKADVDQQFINMVPGVSAYNGMKRLGTSIRSPELLALIEKHKAANKEKSDKPEAEEEKEASSCTSGHRAKKKKKKVKKAALEIATKVAAYRRIQEKQARAVRIKLASYVVRMNELRQELNKYDPYQLCKSAAVGAHKSDRIKAAALVRQIELEKQAFIAAFVSLDLSK